MPKKIEAVTFLALLRRQPAACRLSSFLPLMSRGWSAASLSTVTTPSPLNSKWLPLSQSPVQQASAAAAVRRQPLRHTQDVWKKVIMKREEEPERWAIIRHLEGSDIYWDREIEFKLCRPWIDLKHTARALKFSNADLYVLYIFQFPIFLYCPFWFYDLYQNPNGHNETSATDLMLSRQLSTSEKSNGSDAMFHISVNVQVMAENDARNKEVADFTYL